MVMESEKMSLKECCEIALAIQDASNISGVMLAYRNVIMSLRNIYGYDYKYADNPAIILIHDKLEDMLRIPYEKRTDKYFEAYEKCNEIIKNN